VAHEDDVSQAERLEPRVEIPDVIGEPVCDVRLAGSAHADQVRRQAAGLARDVRDHVAPQV
jgi:hypothetical protein